MSGSEGDGRLRVQERWAGGSTVADTEEQIWDRMIYLNLMLWLASEEAGAIHGALVPVCGPDSC